MTLDSVFFISCFLPLSLLLHWLMPGIRAKNGLLLVLSLVFYAFSGLAALPVLVLGILLTSLGRFSDTLIYLGIAAFGFSLVFQLVTLPVEFNASRRAISAIEDTAILTEEEQKGAKKTLKAAAMTYVAATAVALAQFLRLILLFGNRRRRD